MRVVRPRNSGLEQPRRYRTSRREPAWQDCERRFIRMPVEVELQRPRRYIKVVEINGHKGGLDTKLGIRIGRYATSRKVNRKLLVVAVRGLFKVVICAEHDRRLKVAHVPDGEGVISVTKRT